MSPLARERWRIFWRGFVRGFDEASVLLTPLVLAFLCGYLLGATH